MFFRLFVVDQKLSIFTVSSGLVAGNFDDIKPTGAFTEDGIHFLERSVGSFRVEEIDYRENKSVAKISLLVATV